MRTEVQLDPISAADREEIVDLYNHYVTGSFAAFPERQVSYGFFDLLMHIPFPPGPVLTWLGLD